VTGGHLAEGRRPVSPSRPVGARSIDEILAAARVRLPRLTPQEAYAACEAGATLIDIRPAALRAAAGEVPGSVVIERNHLEWRLDPASDARLPWVIGYELRPIVICAEGYTSSLAAVALQDLGLASATDVIGGYQAWQAAGLPTARPGERAVVIAPGASPALPCCFPGRGEIGARQDRVEGPGGRHRLRPPPQPRLTLEVSG
jgi:rhodanese-related sulfurtransferase